MFSYNVISHITVPIVNVRSLMVRWDHRVQTENGIYFHYGVMFLRAASYPLVLRSVDSLTSIHLSELPCEKSHCGLATDETDMDHETMSQEQRIRHRGYLEN